MDELNGFTKGFKIARFLKKLVDNSTLPLFWLFAMHMKLNEFRSLSEHLQFEVIEQQGVFLAEREEGYYNVRLYAVGNFYAELFCHSHFNVIVRTKAFLTTKKLEPYLQQINISQLLDL